MDETQSAYDDAMYEFSLGNYPAAIERFEALLREHPDNFEAQLALGMAWYRQGDYDRAITEGLKAEKLKPKEQLVHTNLSLFYMKKGDKKTAEAHGLQAKIASWKENMGAPGQAAVENPELQMAQTKAPTVKITGKVPDMPWKKNKPLSTGPSTPTETPKPE